MSSPNNLDGLPDDLVVVNCKGCGDLGTKEFAVAVRYDIAHLKPRPSGWWCKQCRKSEGPQVSVSAAATKRARQQGLRGDR